jgi:imidazoleglycerol phosphate dehydratase HisB
VTIIFTVNFSGTELKRLAPLRGRLAAVLGVSEVSVLPVRGYGHAGEIVERSGLTCELVNESGIEWFEGSSRAAAAAGGDGAVVYRGIGSAYGAETQLCGALISAPAVIAEFERAVGADYLHPLIITEALKALAPNRLVLEAARAVAWREEQTRVIDALKTAVNVSQVTVKAYRNVEVVTTDADAVLSRGSAFAAPLSRIDEDTINILVSDRAANDRVLAAFGAQVGRSPRVGEAIRETKETKIAVRVDLDRAGAVSISTGVGYFDHMLEQIAAHAGIALTLACDGDAHVDLHHTIEDCALALGQALSQALGERRGIARYGFTLPMDEAEARVSIDLGGRPYSVFEGTFAAALIGRYPTEMTAHVFRSLAQTLGAAIHVSVRGENDHHKTEACFKAFARALRAAIAIEGDAVPSTKGVI